MLSSIREPDPELPRPGGGLKSRYRTTIVKSSLLPLLGPEFLTTLWPNPGQCWLNGDTTASGQRSIHPPCRMDLAQTCYFASLAPSSKMYKCADRWCLGLMPIWAERKAKNEIIWIFGFHSGGLATDQESQDGELPRCRKRGSDAGWPWTMANVHHALLFSLFPLATRPLTQSLTQLNSGHGLEAMSSRKASLTRSPPSLGLVPFPCVSICWVCITSALLGYESWGQKSFFFFFF